MAGVVTLAIFCVFLCSAAASYNKIPALLWSNNMLHTFPRTLAGHTTQTNTFLDEYIQNSLASNPQQHLIVFMQDKLNLDDITQHATDKTFQNIKSLISSHPSAHLSGVASPAEAVDQLKRDFNGPVHSLTTSESVQALDFTGGQDEQRPHMVIVDLPSSSVLSRTQQLEQSDRLIGSVMSHMKTANVPYTAVYTGRTPSILPANEIRYTGRHLLVTDDASTNVTFLNVSGCLFFYATKIKLDILRANDKSKLNFTMPPMIDASYTDGECNTSSPGQASLILIYTDPVPDLQLFQLTMLFRMTRSTWQLSNVSLTYQSSTTSQEDVAMVVPSMYQPLKFCYHCEAFKLKQRHTKNNKTALLADIATVSISGLQLQVGTIVGDKFGRANDCIFFFTPPILSGLIVSFVLLAILALGVGLLADMNVIDRFDNPKGKTITVNAPE